MHHSALGQREATVQARNRTDHHARGGEPCRLLRRSFGGDRSGHNRVVPSAPAGVPSQQGQGPARQPEGGKPVFHAPQGVSGRLVERVLVRIRPSSNTSTAPGSRCFGFTRRTRGGRARSRPVSRGTHRAAAGPRRRPGFFKPRPQRCLWPGEITFGRPTPARPQGAKHREVSTDGAAATDRGARGARTSKRVPLESRPTAPEK